MFGPRLVGGALAAVALLGLGSLGAGAAGAQAPVQIKSRLAPGDFCLDASNGGFYAPTLINPCNGTDFQRWALNGLQIESVAYPGKCLAMRDDGGWAHIRPCYNQLSQQWVIQPNGHVVSAGTACLTVLGGANPATQVSTRWCSDDPGQGWDAVP